MVRNESSSSSVLDFNRDELILLLTSSVNPRFPWMQSRVTVQQTVLVTRALAFSYVLCRYRFDYLLKLTVLHISSHGGTYANIMSTTLYQQITPHHYWMQGTTLQRCLLDAGRNTNAAAARLRGPRQRPPMKEIADANPTLQTPPTLQQLLKIEIPTMSSSLSMKVNT